MTLRVYHRLYTHAPDAPGLTGGHIIGLGDIDVGAHLPTPVTEALDPLLASIVAPGPDPAWIVRRFAARGESFACLIVSYPNLVQDGVGREGALTHARVLRVPANRVLLDIQALHECADAISVDEGSEYHDPKALISAYVNKLEDEADVAQWHPAMLQSFPFETLWEITSVLVAYVGAANNSARMVIPTERNADAVRIVAAAWSVLPIAMQMSCSWALNALDSAPTTIHFARGGESRYDVPQRVREQVNDYLELLIESGVNVSSLLANTSIQTIDKLHDALADLQGARVIGEAESSRTISSEVKPSSESAGQFIEPPPVSSLMSTEVLNEHLELFEERFRRFVEDRLSANPSARSYTASRIERLADGGQPPLSPQPQQSSWSSFLRNGAVIATLSALAAGFVIGVVVVGMIVMFAHGSLSRRVAATERQLKETQAALARIPVALPPPRPSPQTPTPQNPSFDLTMIPATNKNWRLRFKWAIENRPDIFVPLAQEIATSTFVPDSARNLVSTHMATAAGKTTLGDDARRQLRSLLFEFVARQSTLPERGATIVIDGNPGEITPEILGDIDAKLQVESPAAELSDDFMAEAVLRWAAQ